MASTEQGNQEIFNKAATLIDTVTRQLEDGTRHIESMGLDPDKVRETVAHEIAAEQVREADEAFKADMEAVEREVAEEAARLSFQTAASSSPRPRRSMI